VTPYELEISVLVLPSSDLPFAAAVAGSDIARGRRLTGMHALKYFKNLDYLMASIIYLGTHEYWWARSPTAMAKELGLDSGKLQAIFDSFPGIYRKSERKSETDSITIHCRRDMRRGKMAT
jgi:hypothetical protein